MNLEFFLDGEGRPGYILKQGEMILVDSSRMGFDLEGQVSWGKDLEVKNVVKILSSETWQTIWGERTDVDDHHREMRVELKEKGEKGREVDVVFRLFDDGLGFRYEFPLQEGPSHWTVTDEKTEFVIPGDPTAFWIPADYDSYEHLYTTSKLSEIDATAMMNWDKLIASSIKEPHAANTPLTLRHKDGVHLSIHEAALVDYPGMTLRVEEDKHTLTSSLVPSKEGWKARFRLPFHTPWRTITIGESARALAESDLILNLNEPSKFEDVTWIKPQKYIGIWWGMHIDKYSWHAGPKHGATTENVKKYIDFAAENGIPAVLIEGWNTGWENWFDAEGRKTAFDWVTPYPDFDLEGMVAYGKEKGVSIVGHHETSSVVYKYDTLMEAAFAQAERLGIPAVKTGYVGKILPEGEYHHGQWMVQHYQRSVETAARHHIMVDIHEPIKPTGLRRTWPNLMTREGVQGTEFNAWSTGNPPEHITILPFTRGLAGPIDYTPGIFNLSLKPYKPENRMHSTLANQLAQYVVLYSPLAMAADLPEHYEAEPAPFQFIREVPTDWEQSLVLQAEIGDYVCFARKERGGLNWYVGGVTDENAREMEIVLDFLDGDMSYDVDIYRDGEDAHYHDNPTSYVIEQKKEVKQGEKITLQLAPGGGFAMALHAK